MAFVVILAVQLSRLKLTPALKSGLIKADRENDGEFECFERGRSIQREVAAASK